MTAFTFSNQRVAALRKRSEQLCATLVLPSEQVRAETIRTWYREFMLHDADGAEVGLTRRPVQDVGYAGDLRDAKITVLLIELADVYAEVPCSSGVPRVLDLAAARASGCKTLQELRDGWRSRHPRSEFAKLIWFAQGDVRDKDRFMQRYIHRGGDYTGDRRSAIDELPALSEAQLRELAANAHQRELRQAAHRQATYTELSLAQRLARIESAGEVLRLECKNELAIIAERTRRGLRKLD